MTIETAFQPLDGCITGDCGVYVLDIDASLIDVQQPLHYGGPQTSCALLLALNVSKLRECRTATQDTNRMIVHDAQLIV